MSLRSLLRFAPVAAALMVLGLITTSTASAQTLLSEGTSNDFTVLPPEPNCGDPIPVSVLTGDDDNSLSPPRYGIGGGMVPQGEVSVDLPPGVYRVESVTVDRYAIRATTGLQAHEQVRLRFFSGATEQDVTPYTADLQDGFEAAWAITDLGTVNLPDGADRIVIEHYGLDNPVVSPESLKVSSICAVLDSSVAPTTVVSPCADDDGDDDGIVSANDVDDPCGPCTDGDSDGVAAENDLDDPCGPCADNDGDDDGVAAENDVDDPCGPCTDGDGDGVAAENDLDDPCGPCADNDGDDDGIPAGEDADDPCGTTTTAPPVTAAPTTTPPTVAPTTIQRETTTTTVAETTTETTPPATVLDEEVGRLPVTGSETVPLVWFGSILAAVGVLLAVVARRRELV